MKILKEKNIGFKEAFHATGMNHVYKNKKTIIKSIVLLFIPFLYAFIALWAFFDPLGNINRLPIALVNQDISEQGNNRIINRKVLGLDNVKPNKLEAYQFMINDIKISGKKKDFTVDYFDDQATYKKHQSDVTFLTTILINQQFTTEWNHYFEEVFKIIIAGGDDIWAKINAIKNKPEITLHASYKVSPILGEINDFALNTLKNNIFGMFFPSIASDQLFNYWYQDAHNQATMPNYNHLKPKITAIYNWISILIPGMGAHKEEFKEIIESVSNDDTWIEARDHEKEYWMNHSLTAPLNFIDFNINIDGQDKSPYGFGLGPYFICIGMWIGGLLLTFTFTRNKDLKKTNFWSNYLAKSAWMVIFGLLQATILTISLLLLFNSADLFIRSWQLLLYMWVIGICFDLIIQAIAHMFRDHDIGRFLIVLLLILQLSSSSGTFPVQLEPGFFQFMYHILPFSYAIQGLREILITPNSLAILSTIGILLLFVLVFVTISLLLNWCYDFSSKKKIKNKNLSLDSESN